MIVLLCIIYFGIIVFEVPGLIKRQYWYELMVFFLLLVISFIFSLLYTMDVDIPSPVIFIEKFIRFVFKFIGIKI